LYRNIYPRRRFFKRILPTKGLLSEDFAENFYVYVYIYAYNEKERRDPLIVILENRRGLKLLFFLRFVVVKQNIRIKGRCPYMRVHTPVIEIRLLGSLKYSLANSVVEYASFVSTKESRNRRTI